MSRWIPSISRAFVTIALLAAACGPSSSATTDAQPIDCPQGFGDCDGDRSNGCEADLTSIDACGACGGTCGGQNASPQCVDGQCVMNCAAGFDNCDFNPGNGCEASLDNPLHCGQCNLNCNVTNGVGECVAGECQVTCADGYDDCNDDLADGCESDLTADTSCGSCDVGCAGTCVGGACQVCDDALALDSADPMDAARAIGLCADVTSARWLLPDGTDVGGAANFELGHGILPAFGSGVAPREGTKLLALSSGTARQPTDPGYQNVSGFDKGYTTGHPTGFPKETPACPGVVTGDARDGIALEVTLAVPSWAEGFSFDFDFYTYEWPIFICSTYNDFFVAMLDPIPMGQPDGNISFDSMGNPVSVNNAFLDACGCLVGPPCSAGGKTFDCALGTTTLAGTGFESGAATGWLVTTAPAEPDTEITLRFIVYDSGDGVLDSTTIIDGFRWLPQKPDVGTNPIP